MNMEVLSWLFLAGFAFTTILFYSRNVELSKIKRELESIVSAEAAHIQVDDIEIARLKGQLEALKASSIDPTQVVPRDMYNADLSSKQLEIANLNIQLADVTAKYESERGKAISDRVRLGHVSENFAPMLESFPYDRHKCKPLFQPIDYIYFGDDEIVFIDIKSGDSSPSTKQRNIRKLVQEGKVRFEIHQISDKGYEIK